MSTSRQTFGANWRTRTSAVLVALVPIVVPFLLRQRHVAARVAGRDSRASS